MVYVIIVLLAGVFSGGVSIAFRLYEIGTEKIFVGKQFIAQLVLFWISSYVFWNFFSEYFLEIGIVRLNWFFIFFLFSSLSYYMVQVLFEWKSKISLFPTEQEIEEYLEKNMQ